MSVVMAGIAGCAWLRYNLYAARLITERQIRYLLPLSYRDENREREVNMAILVCGVGVNNRKYQSSTNGRSTKPYSLWQTMLYRCYSPKKLSISPSYFGCSVSDDFKYYHVFYEWVICQHGYANEKWDLDKDVLFPGNKVYSAETCVFIPHELNSLITPITTKKNQGVCWHKRDKVYRAKMLKKGRSVEIGRYKTELDAARAYVNAKQSYILSVADAYKDHLRQDVYDAVCAYKVIYRGID